jgi:hypothetical protein
MALTRAYVEAGQAIAYLPVGLVEGMSVRKVKVVGCSLSCSIKAHIICASAAPGWVRQLV